LDALVGTWKIEIYLGEQLVALGKTEFEWLQGMDFLVQRVKMEPSPPGAPPEWVDDAPHEATTIIGLDDSSETFSMLQADSRGVFRVYLMTLNDGIWTTWRDAPEFYQRTTGTFSDDGNTITSQVYFSSDGINWDKDFDLTYSKLT
jgi:hypothetical protein